MLQKTPIHVFHPFLPRRSLLRRAIAHQSRHTTATWYSSCGWKKASTMSHISVGRAGTSRTAGEVYRPAAESPCVVVVGGGHVCGGGGGGGGRGGGGGGVVMVVAVAVDEEVVVNVVVVGMECMSE